MFRKIIFTLPSMFLLASCKQDDAPATSNWQISIPLSASVVHPGETIDINTTASHLRLYSHTGLGSDGCSIKEFEAYGYPASTPTLLGDLNQSGAVELTDIPHFVDALLGNPPANAGIAQARADMNNDSLWDGADIQLFVEALIAP